MDRLLEPPNLDAYYASKLMLEAMVSPHFDRMNVTIGRFFFIYGPGQGQSKLLPRLINSVRSGKPVTVTSEGGVKLNPIYVDDAARIVERCLQLDGSRIINVAGPQATTIRGITERIGRLVGARPVFELGGTDRNLVADITLLRSISNDPLIELDEGLSRTVDPYVR
jgi:nucleoside-diphosphate-sugar epimerase